jgi:hypothetical protein
MNMLYNKLLFQPFVEMWNNRDYFGRDIYDVNAPEYQQAYQFAKHIFGDQFSPITISGSKRAIETGGTYTKDVPLSFLGFGPAPAYASRTPTQNRISYLYQRHVSPYSKSEPQTDVDEQKRQARTAYRLAQTNNDKEGMQEAANMMADAGIKKAPKYPGDVSMFKSLPDADQLAILKSAPKDEREKYEPYVHKKLRADIGHASGGAIRQVLDRYAPGRQN